MTVVLGVVADGASWLAIDDGVSFSGSLIRSPSKRLVRHNVMGVRLREGPDGDPLPDRVLGEIGFGIAGLGNAIALHLFSWKCPSCAGDETVDQYMNAVARSLRLHLREAGWPELKDDHDETLDGHMLVAFNGRLWVMDSCFGLIEIVDSFAIGCGGHVAWGAFVATREAEELESHVGHDRNTPYCVERAFKIAADRVQGVGSLAELVRFPVVGE